MIDLTIYGNKVESVFELIGQKEDDISKAVGWAFSRCPQLLRLFVEHVTGYQLGGEEMENVSISLQAYESQKGFTDFEVSLPGEFFLIVEAKRGWVLPSEEQLTKYAARREINQDAYRIKKLVTLSECSNEYAGLYSPKKNINGIEIKHVSWKDIWNWTNQAYPNSSNAGKRLLGQLHAYLSKIMSMQNIFSNWVFVVSLGAGFPEGWEISWRDIVNLKGKYFHPVGNRWPKEPPNYIAFRYDGMLQTIHHIEKYEVFKNPKKWFDEAFEEEWPPHFLYFLGPPIRPNHEVKNGNIHWNGRYYCMLDTLLTSSTISEAKDITNDRYNSV